MSQTKAETTIRWETKTFGQLSAGELYDILRLRAEVFVVEQRCAYQDLDGLPHIKMVRRPCNHSAMSM